MGADPAAHMQGMSTNHSNRNRVPEGVPTGGQFAAERRGESTLTSLTAPTTAEPSLAERRQAAEEAFDANPLDLDPKHTRALLEAARADRDGAQGRLDEYRAQERLMRLRGAVGSAVFRHGASGPEAMKELEAQMQESAGGQGRGSFRHADTGYELRLDDLYTHSPRMRRAFAQARGMGIGEDSTQISLNEAKRRLAPGTRARRVDLTGARREAVSQVSFDELRTSRGATTVIRDSRGQVLNEAIVGPSWATPRRAHLDRHGNIIITDGDSHMPNVAYQPLED